MKIINFLKVGIMSVAMLLLVSTYSSCAKKNPIKAAFTNQAAVPCNGAVRLPFTASHKDGDPIAITGKAAVATGPNSDCATVTLLPDSDPKADVIDLAVSVNCDCTPGQTITVVITVSDNKGNVMDAWATVTT